MAEPTCVMQPFSYTTTTPTHFSNETTQELNPTMYGLGESVSFGRYVYEDLEWEKWSSFNSTNRNRYVAEAEKYSKPGSVAQKKAYFEAHFKRMAALKAAALLEQAQNSATAQANVVSVTANDHAQDLNSSSNLQVETKGFPVHNVSPQVRVRQTEKITAEKFVVHQNELFSTGAKDDEDEGNDHKETDVNPSPPPPPPPPDHKTSQKHEVSAMKKEENIDVHNEELSEIVNQMERPLLQEETTEVVAVVKKKKTPLSSYISSPAVVFAQSPVRPDYIHPGKENYATPVKTSKSSISSDQQKKKTPLRMSINREFSRILSPVIKKLGSSKTPSKTPAKGTMNNNVSQPPPMTPDISKRGAAASPSTARSKANSPIIPNSFCLRNEERTGRRKQRLEDKFNATATERVHQPSKFKEKAEAELNKFRQSFCFKAMSSPDYYGDNGTFKSPKHKNESTNRKSPSRGRQSNRTASQNTSLPPRRPSLNQNGLRSKRNTLVPS